MHSKNNNNKSQNFIQGLRPFSSSIPKTLKKHLKAIHEKKKFENTNYESKEPNFEEASHESEMANVTDKGMSKPKISYAGLISEALLNSHNGMLILSDIYESISARHPYYKMNVPGWQNSIRHNLTLNKSFVKCTDGLKKAKDGKYSNYWKLS